MSSCTTQADEFSLSEAPSALKKAVHFLRTGVAKNSPGGYLWRYSADLKRREGEGVATDTLAWVQPPGTPTVGMAFLDAYRATGDSYLLDAAKESAYALVSGQLKSGGWDYRIEFDKRRRSNWSFRVDDGTGQRSVTTFDDNTTQSAMRFLMQIDKELKFKDAKIHEAIEYALNAFLKAQYPNGGWPQRYSRFPKPENFPVKKAGYPKSWPKIWPKKKYNNYYTFNDNAIADTIATMFDAAEIYDEPKYRAAAERAGDFIILAQMPEPQPIWAQQYNADMHPAWARKFEPPSVTGEESQGVLRTLMFLYRKTGNDKYLKPIPAALDYLERSELPGGKLARFYELKTNKPLYFTKQYKLVYTADDLPTHYGFIVGSKLDSIQKEYDKLLKTPKDKLDPPRKPQKYKLSSSLMLKTQSVLDGLDSRGAWTEPGKLKYHGDDDPTTRIIDMKTVVSNIGTLSAFITAAKSKK
jgi:PelA/Pel-15E family pectate lyase